MSKNEKRVSSVAVDSQEVIAMLPKLESLLKTYIEISKGYRLYRENGGEMISGIEEHLGVKTLKAIEQPEKTKKVPHVEVPEKNIKVKKDKQKDKHTQKLK